MKKYILLCLFAFGVALSNTSCQDEQAPVNNSTSKAQHSSSDKNSGKNDANEGGQSEKKDASQEDLNSNDQNKSVDENNKDVNKTDSSKPTPKKDDEILKEKLDSLENLNSKTVSSISNLKEEIKKLDESNNSLETIMVVLFSISIIGCGVVYYLCSKLISGNNDYIKQLEKSVNNELKPHNKSSQNVTGSDIKKIEAKINGVREELIGMIKNHSHITQASQAPVSNPSYNPSNRTQRHDVRVCYANLNTDKYFTQIYDDYQEGCAFKISYSDNGEGKFEILALKNIQSHNQLESAVEYVGNCLLDEATSFKTDTFGRCTRRSDGVWEITQRTKIKINR